MLELKSKTYYDCLKKLTKMWIIQLANTTVTFGDQFSIIMVECVWQLIDGLNLQILN